MMIKETRGRKKKFSPDLLREIAVKYIKQGHVGEVTASKLATFAKKLGYDDIKYYHFTRNADALKDIILFDSAGGRGRKYTVSDLEEIIDKCCNAMTGYEKVNVANLVKCAKKLGYKDINAYHFNKEPEIKGLIEALGRDSSLLENDEEKANFKIQHANILRADDILESFKTSPAKLKIILRDFSDKYESLKLDYLNLLVQFNKAKEELSEYQQLEEQYKRLKENHDYYKNEYKRISKYDGLNDKLLMFERLNEMGTKVHLSEEAVLALTKTNQRTNDNLKENEAENWLGDYSKDKFDDDLGDNLENNASKKVVPLKRGADEKVKDADGFFSRRHKDKK